MSKPMIIVAAVLLVVLIGIADYLAGWEFHVSALYLVLIGWVSWRAGRQAGFVLAGVAAAVFLVGDLKSGSIYQHAFIPYWNAMLLLIVFLALVILLSAFQTAHCHLEDVVQQRTATLQAEIMERKRLEKSNLQAERLATVGTMAAQVAHEVRNPLGSITLNLDLIRKEIDSLAGTSVHPPAEGRVLVDEMRAEVHRIQHVIEDYLQFARLPKAQCQPLAVNALLDQKLAFMHGSFEEAKVKLQTEFDPKVATILADGGQLWQAVLNLVRNSLEAMPTGGVLTVGTQQQADQVLLRVTDTGRGMIPERVSQLFEPFFTTKANGTGLGLVLVQQIVTEHGGRIECASTPGKGSTFSIFLPAPGGAIN